MGKKRKEQGQKKMRNRNLSIDEIPCQLIISIETQGKVKGKQGKEECCEVTGLQAQFTVGILRKSISQVLFRESVCSEHCSSTISC